MKITKFYIIWTGDVEIFGKIRIYNRYREFKSFIGCQKKNVHLVDRTHLFKISNLEYDVRAIVRSLVVCFLLGDSPASEIYMPTFRNTLFHLHRQVGECRMNESEGNVGVLYMKRFGLEMV